MCVCIYFKSLYVKASLLFIISNMLKKGFLTYSCGIDYSLSDRVFIFNKQSNFLKKNFFIYLENSILAIINKLNK